MPPRALVDDSKELEVNEIVTIRVMNDELRAIVPANEAAQEALRGAGPHLIEDFRREAILGLLEKLQRLKG